MNTDLHSFVRAKVLERRGDWPRLAKDLGVSYSWLQKFAGDYPHDVGHRRLVQLAQYFQTPADGPKEAA